MVHGAVAAAVTLLALLATGAGENERQRAARHPLVPVVERQLR